MDLTSHITRFRARFGELETELAKPNLFNDQARAQEVTREHARLKEILALAEKYEQLSGDLREAREMAESGDEELAELAAEELERIPAELENATRQMRFAVVPPDPTDSRNTIVEIRAGTGGNEAALFAADLQRMYQRCAERTGWKVEIMDASAADLGGVREVVFAVNGEDVYKKLKYESGVHRVQRVPATETQGRIHTSTATVAVLPEAEEVDVEIKPEEIRVDITRSGGPGGQGVNTTDSCVQITHLPTGLIVRCQDARSQHKNKDKAMGILRARLLERREQEEHEKYAQHRKSQIGSGDRNEKIRTYNFPQNRITDHRINFTTHNLPGVLDGDLEELLQALMTADLEDKLAALESEGAAT
ncbi:MAG: peptide chain release factor 1 [Verrucomicrobiota bacterium]